MNGDKESNKELRQLLLACNTHKCSEYCQKDGGLCKSFFPRFPQSRASIALAARNEANARYVSYSPRSEPHVNATHLIMPAIFHGNTDVSVILGSGIGPSCYVTFCSVKNDEKDRWLDARSVQRLQNLSKEAFEDDKQLLGSIARSSESLELLEAKKQHQI